MLEPCGLRLTPVSLPRHDVSAVFELLEAEGADVSLASSGGHVLELLDHGLRPDAVLMDVQMPETDGLETTIRLRSNPAHTDLLVIAMTADVSITIVLAALNLQTMPLARMAREKRRNAP